ncbi:MAG: Type 1 glutamine amidotransferase-like domain-containing protein, partial [Patescibacteria group bacterium]
DNNILSVAREKIKSGTSYVGVSAGAVIACPTIKIWYEMPIVLPPSLDSLSVIPFQITPHYFDVDANREIGKSPKRRIEEFLLINDEIVVALYEGSRLRVENGKTVVEGKGGAIVFKKNEFPKRYEPGDILFGEQIEHP